FIERTGGDNSTERFIPFFSEEPTPEAEKKAFAKAWAYVQASQPCIIYYYSKYERTHYRLLREKYPCVCTEADVEAMFDPARAVDLLYDVVRKATEWPTRDHSIKTLAKYLGFKYRDAHPSGAASIEWFHRWVEEGDPAVKQHILEYNEDDCRATRVLLDGIRTLAA
ncbi:TM0106 family RecB-like putative nuclease, partial [Candidatus Uhrbacteria bacterium]|nr:TM0106 family RecB-like putative nuclease [Candidatus Uhrbacteria bacterium]